jgi:hypothetical protein
MEIILNRVKLQQIIQKPIFLVALYQLTETGQKLKQNLLKKLNGNENIFSELNRN